MGRENASRLAEVHSAKHNSGYLLERFLGRGFADSGASSKDFLFPLEDDEALADGLPVAARFFGFATVYSGVAMSLASASSY